MRTEEDIRAFLNRAKGSEHWPPHGHFTDIVRDFIDPTEAVEFGLVTGYGAAFAYRGKGVIVLGAEEDIDMVSPFAERFIRDAGATSVANGELLLYDPNGCDNLRVYRYPHLEYTVHCNAQWGDNVVDKYIRHLQNLSSQQRSGHPLRAIVQFRLVQTTEEDTMPLDLDIPHLHQARALLNSYRKSHVARFDIPLLLKPDQDIKEYDIPTAYRLVKSGLDARF